MIVVKSILYFGHNLILACDGNCRKAWGNNSRPQRALSDDEDDFVWLADGVLGDAPVDPGTYEGCDAKPTNYDDPYRQNKWCTRECERSELFEIGEPIVIRDLGNPKPNIPREAQSS